jgi:hypothetical protein
VHTTQYQALDVRRRRLIVAALAAAFVARAGSAFASASVAPAFSLGHSRVAAATQVAQAEGEEAAPPSDQVDKYIAVYTAMQRDHNLTVDQAASKQGLTVAQFRSLEDRIQRNPVVHDRVLAALKAASKGGKKPASKTP